jgi:hypothetical protein
MTPLSAQKMMDIARRLRYVFNKSKLMIPHLLASGCLIAWSSPRLRSDVWVHMVHDNDQIKVKLSGAATQHNIKEIIQRRSAALARESSRN